MRKIAQIFVAFSEKLNFTFQYKKKSAEALDRTTERLQMGPTYLSLVYKHPQYKVEGCWSYTERMILAVTGPFFFFLDAYIAYRVRTPVEEC